MQSVSLIFNSALACLLLLWTACAPQKHDTPPAGAAVGRVVSLAPSLTEAVFALGAGGMLVGRSNYCDYPEAAVSVDAVGQIDLPNLERILSLSPDLVVVTGLTPRDVVARMEGFGLRVVCLEAERLEDIVGTYKELGALLDREEVAADLAQGIEAVLAETAASSQALSGDPPRACLLYSYEPPYFSAGKGTFPSALLGLAGFKNIADTALLPWPQLNLEWLVKQNPEFIFIATGSDSRPVENELARLRASGVWAQISAIKEGRLYAITNDALSIPGLRTLDALAVFSAARAEIP